MIVEHRVLGAQLHRALEVMNRLFPVALAEVRPAEAVDDVAVVGLQRHGLLDQLNALLEVAVLIDPGIAEVVQNQGLVGIELQRLLQVDLGLAPVLHALVAGAARVVVDPVPLLGPGDQRDGARVVVGRFLVALARAHDVAECVERLDVGRIVLGDLLQQFLGFVGPLERVEVERLADLDRGLQRAALGDAVVGGDGIAELLGRLVAAGERGQGERLLRRDEQRHLQIDDAEADAAFTGQGFAQAIEHLGQTLCRIGDQQAQPLSGIEAIAQVAGERMALALGTVEVLLEDGAGKLGVAERGRVPGVGQRRAERPVVLLEHLLVGGARFHGAAGDVGDQRLVVGDVELRPLGRLLAVDDLERRVGLALGQLDPGASQRARQFADGAAAGALEMRVGLVVGAALEGFQRQEQVSHAVLRLLVDEIAGELGGLRPIPRRDLHQKRLLHQDLVARVELESGAVEVGGLRGVVLGSGETAGEIAAEQRMLRAIAVVGDAREAGLRTGDQDRAHDRGKRHQGHGGLGQATSWTSDHQAKSFSGWPGAGDGSETQPWRLHIKVARI